MSIRFRLPLLLLATALLATGACAEAPEDNEAGSPESAGRTATAPRPEDLAATETIADQQAAAAGQTVFVDKNCTMCHSVTTANVKGISDAGPDLAGVGTRRGGKDGITSFVRSAEHPKAWEGTDAELASVAEWLATK